MAPVMVTERRLLPPPAPPRRPGNPEAVALSRGRGTDGSVHHLQPSSEEAVSAAHPSCSHQSSHSSAKAPGIFKPWSGILHTLGGAVTRSFRDPGTSGHWASPPPGCLPALSSKARAPDQADLPLYSSSRGRRMAIHLCSMPQSRMENLRRECANRHCEPDRPRHHAARLAEHHAGPPNHGPGPAKNSE